MTIPVGPAELDGDLVLPEEAEAVVLFAHGSGSSRRSPRNRFVAERLQQAGLGTLLFDLLTPIEADDRANVFDIFLLAERLVRATQWMHGRHERLRIGYFGASTGAAAALWAAAAPELRIGAVVSRGGRPDLAGERLTEVTAPTLFIVGGHDEVVLDLNQRAERLLGGPSQLAVIPGATHLFEEPGTLEAAADLAREWFTDHLAPQGP
ncbi:alpha/beta hydrolase [Glycomyces luteolus]|uniref:Alpha/beta hydrolase n=1 Tax=Glycomyces luteolus TaxID=2670330 RepID=A0A9X3T3W4_9ACTN|nr:alpha/beta hydrolase [Glycomyces luteolus]MDA1360415.1 alpha/beta hydrolase [Glycomyces luteolus]